MISEHKNTLTLSASSPAFPPRFINITLFVISLLAFSLNLYNLLKDESVSHALLLVAILIAITVGLVFFIKKVNQHVELSVNSERVRSTESGGVTRTAYFSKLRDLKLTQNGIYVSYLSGYKERFILPSYSDEEFEKLQNFLAESAKNYSFSFDVKKSWLGFLG